MPTTTQKHAPGTPCWPELATTDQPGAKKFYGALFGWDIQDAEMGGGETYTTLKLGGRAAGALYSMQKAQRDQGIPPNWMNYIAVENADQSAARAKQLGGQVIVGPMDVMEHGRMAVIQDPTGAVFSLWQPKQHPGVGVRGEPGSLVWSELYTGDPDKAGNFYTGLFGYTTEVMTAGSSSGSPVGGIPYTIFQLGDTGVAGMMKPPKEWGNVPPHWLTYFAVENCDATVTRAQQLGGKVTVPPFDIPDIGRMAMLQDPQGAMFAVIKTLPRPS